MAFKMILDGLGETVSMPMAASVTINEGDALIFASGYLTPATNTTTEVKYVSLESRTTGAAETPEILVVRAGCDTIFEADTSVNTSQAYVGTKVSLATAGTLDCSDTTDKAFFVERVIGAAANKKVQGYFVAKVV